ncbi:MAG: hypothetical protein AB7O92_33460 [Acidimicrobiia bacterium]
MRKAQRRLLAIALGLGLVAAACGGDDSGEDAGGSATTAAGGTETSAGGSTGSTAAAGGAAYVTEDRSDAKPFSGEVGAFAKEQYTTDLKSVCPAELVVQKDWLAEAEHAAFYQLIGGGGKMSQYVYEGPLGSTGINLKILDGGPGSDQGVPYAATLYTGNSVAGAKPDLAFVSTDDAILFSEKFPVKQVLAQFEKNPQMLMFDPEKWDISSVEDIIAAVDEGANLYVTTKSFSYVQFLIGKGVPEDAFIEGYAGDKDKFITGGGDIINQGYASNEIYTFERETEQFNKPVGYVLIHDLGYQAYPMALSVAADREAELAPCLEKFIPLVQQAQMDYVTNPDEINTLLADYNDNDLGAPFWKTSLGLNAAAVDIMKSAELVGNGPDDTLGNFDEARVQSMIDLLLPIFEENGQSGFKKGLKAADLVTNDYIDPSIGMAS